VIKVLIGQVHLARAPKVLQAVLGSCIGVSIYDQSQGLAGMAHVLLPSSGGRPEGALPGKYADKAIPCLYEAMLKYGASARNLKAKIAGGSRMFKTAIKSESTDVGGMNIDSVKDALKIHGIPVVGSDVGGTLGRKVEFRLSTWEFVVEDFANRRLIL
jgi:chemotaxis protein CheD